VKQGIASDMAALKRIAENMVHTGCRSACLVTRQDGHRPVYDVHTGGDVTRR
jgi:hypothetical protein